MDDVLVTTADLRAIDTGRPRAGFCAAGTRTVARSIGIDFNALVRGEVKASELEATGNDFAIQLASQARARAAK